jgi:hypothetical protein
MSSASRARREEAISFQLQPFFTLPSHTSIRREKVINV